MTRVGYLLRTFPVLSETFVTGEIKGIREHAGYTPYVAALYRPGIGAGGGWEEADGPVRYFRDLDKRQVGQMLLSHASYLKRVPVNALQVLTASSLSVPDRIKVALLAKEIQLAGVTHLHTHFAWEQVDYLLAIKKLTGIPYSVMLHAADIFVETAKVAQRLAGAAFVTTISEYNRELLLEQFDLPEERVHVVRCGIVPPENTFSAPVNVPSYASAAKAEQDPQESPLRIISVGRMVEKKGFDVLLQALATLRERGFDFRAELVGNGPLHDSLVQQAERQGLQDVVRFSGALTSGEVLQRISESDVFALCCKRAENGDMDGIPVVLMEAMSLGKPVVTTRLSGIPELVTPACGPLTDPGDAEGIAVQLAELAGSAVLRETRGQAGRQQVTQGFLREQQVHNVLDLAAKHQHRRETV